MNELALFAGAGGGILGGQILGWRTVCAVEIDEHCRDVLVARQNDGCLEPFPIWDDIRTFDGRPWRGRVDVVSGGFPCQDISCAGKGAGLDGERSGLWREMRRTVSEVRPRYVFIENSPMLAVRGGARVIADLAALGFDCRWGVVGAHHTGAPHKRDRMWIVGSHSDSRRLESKRQQEHGNQQSSRRGESDRLCEGRRGQREKSDEVPDSSGTGSQGREQSKTLRSQRNRAQAHGSTGKCSSIPGPVFWDKETGADWWATEPGLGGVVTGMDYRDDIHGTPEPGSVPRLATGIRSRVGRLKAIGNGQVPACAALAWRILTEQ